MQKIRELVFIAIVQSKINADRLVNNIDRGKCMSISAQLIHLVIQFLFHFRVRYFSSTVSIEFDV